MDPAASSVAESRQSNSIFAAELAVGVVGGPPLSQLAHVIAAAPDSTTASPHRVPRLSADLP
ncbi:MAG: hypothetical protein KDA59_23940, partial [Planctomycetales bacterium]|nr:hypothetical protein [Planctomycetales bacterium]